jgi:hypothetical protein
MHLTRLARGLGILAAVTVAGCKSLDIQNPNAPDARRALSDPAALEAVASGSMKKWMNTWEGLVNTGPTDVLCTMANSCTASWNNDNMRHYSDITGTSSDCPARCEWGNDPSNVTRGSIETYWYGYYSALSSANDVLKAIRQNHLVITDAATTKRTETVAQLMQAASLAEIAINYDKGYISFDSTDLTALVYSDRKAMRDAALAKFDATIALANANAFTTPAGWTNGTSYSNTQIARIANTMAARLLAYWPRSAAENAQVNWARVISYASKGISTGGAFDFIFTGDGDCNTPSWCPYNLTWFDDMNSGRVHTRIAHMMDPATQKDPFDSTGGGSPPPKSPDKRLGNGTFGNSDTQANNGTIPKDAGAGTDFAWSSQNVMRPSRGMYHQSNIAFVRWDCDGLDDANSIGYGFCPSPVLMASQNDLIWAEALIRSGGDLNLAATLINNSRVKRGGLPPATAGDGVAGLTTKLIYEQEVELFALGATSYYNNRRYDSLYLGTPAEMPVPAKELGVFGQPLYTWGGGGNPRQSPTPP